MPQLPTVIPNSDRETVTYIASSADGLRLQLEASDDVRDVRGRIIERGSSLAAKFENGAFTTNIGDIIDGIENSYKYKAGLIEKQSVLEARAAEIQLNGVLELVNDNPELAKELRSRLTKQQMAAKKGAEAASEVSAESNDSEE
jgi:hypothetical protein